MSEPTRGLLDTNILILRRVLEPEHLPDQAAISAITLAELSAGVQLVRGSAAEDVDERARRLQVLQLTEHEFDPIPFDAAAARAFGRISALTVARGRTVRRRLADLLIASVASAEGIPLYTTNPDDFDGLESAVTIVPVPRPETH